MIIITTHEIEKMLGITKKSLIYYEKEGFINQKRGENNYRDYDQKDIDILRLIFSSSFYRSIYR